MKHLLWVGMMLVLALQLPAAQMGKAEKKEGNKSGSVEDQIKKMADEGREAALKGDASFLEKNATDDYMFISATGVVLTKSEVIEMRKSGDIKLCGLQQQARKALEMTNLLSVFETYDSIAEAIMAAYLGSRYSKDKSGDAQSRVLCVYDAEDVRTFLTEVLCRAGYNALATANVQDAALLLKATKAKLVIVGWNMRSSYGKPTQKMLEEFDPSASLLVLDEHFSQDDPGEAAAKLLESIRARESKTGEHSS